jgi:hypothetical protein
VSTFVSAGVKIWWTRQPAPDGRYFVFSPRFGNTYLLSIDLVISKITWILLGLRPSHFRHSLADPAESVALVGGRAASLQVGWFLPLLYRFFNNQRTIVSIGRAIRLAKWLARLRVDRGHQTVIEIGRAVIAVERSVGVSDCYPRALLTAYLCLSARLPCRITIGILAPSRNMHAWCSTGGVIPYEPVRLNWWYSPLAVYDVTL